MRDTIKRLTAAEQQENLHNAMKAAEDAARDALCSDGLEVCHACEGSCRGAFYGAVCDVCKGTTVVEL